MTQHVFSNAPLSWPKPDKYNADFRTLDDYSNWIHKQLQNIPTDFAPYKTWIQTPSNQVLIADLADAAGLLILHGSVYSMNESKIDSSAIGLETWDPKESDFANLISALKSLWPEPDAYDAGWTNADQYMNFISSLKIPADAPDFKSWIENNRQMLADLLDASNKLVNTYSSPFSPFLNKLIDDVNNLQTSGVQALDLKNVSLDVKYYNYDKGFTTAQQYVDFLKAQGAAFPSGSNPPDYEQWIEQNGVFLHVIQDAVQKASAMPSPYSTFLAQMQTDLNTLTSSQAKGTDLSVFAQDLEYVDYNKGFQTDQGYIDFLKGIYSQIPSGTNPPSSIDWLQSHIGLLNAVMDASARLSKNQNTSAYWDQIWSHADVLKYVLTYYPKYYSADDAGHQISWLGTNLQYIGNVSFTNTQEALQYLVNQYQTFDNAKIPYEPRYNNPALAAWINDQSHRELFQNLYIAINYVRVSTGNSNPRLERDLVSLLGTIENLEATNAGSDSVSDIGQQLQSLFYYINP